jgi:hypothetical protein
MTGTSVARPRARRVWLVAVAVLVLALGALAAYLLNRPASHPVAAGNATLAPAASSAASAAAAANAPPGAPSPAPSGASAASNAPAAPAKAARSPAPPDSAVNPDAVFLDPAATASHTPQPGIAGRPPSCGNWRADMSSGQRTTYAAALLRAAWQNDGSSATPPGRTVRAYSAAITAACGGKNAAGDAVADVAHAVYAGDHKRWEP